jgi:hypothetical protein
MLRRTSAGGAVADPGTPLITYGQFTEGAFGDLVSAGEPDAWPESVVNDYLLEGTRLVEEKAGGRRLAPFTVTETHRSSAIDPDEYAESANLPMDILGSLGMSYATSLGGTQLVRHCWVNEFPARYPDMWAYSDVTATIIRSYGGTEQLQPTQILDGPDDTGHIWFQLGLFNPVGSRVRVTYSGGYVVNVPASLVRGTKFMTAYIIVRELDPKDSNHDPDQLLEDAVKAIGAWPRA